MALDNNYLLFSQQPLQFDWDPQYSCFSSPGLALGDVNNNTIVPPLGIISNTLTTPTPTPSEFFSHSHSLNYIAGFDGGL